MNKFINEFNVNVVDLWTQGLRLNEPALIAEAIDLGIDVNTPRKYSQQAPVSDFLRGKYYPSGERKFLKCLPEDQKKIMRITCLILAENPELLEKDNSGQNAADRCMYLNANTEAGAYVAIAAIHQSITESNDVYKINLRDIFSGLTDDNPAQYPIRTITMDKIESTHNLVREKLENPRTMLEKDLVAHHGEKIAFWLKRFERPAINSLPSASAEFSAALDKTFGAVKSAIGGLGSFEDAANCSKELTVFLIEQRKKRYGPA